MPQVLTDRHVLGSHVQHHRACPPQACGQSTCGCRAPPAQVHTCTRGCAARGMPHAALQVLFPQLDGGLLGHGRLHQVLEFRQRAGLRVGDRVSGGGGVRVRGRSPAAVQSTSTSFVTCQEHRKLGTLPQASQAGNATTLRHAQNVDGKSAPPTGLLHPSAACSTLPTP